VINPTADNTVAFASLLLLKNKSIMAVGVPSAVLIAVFKFATVCPSSMVILRVVAEFKKLCTGIVILAI
jgi:hypothetical protein